MGRPTSNRVAAGRACPQASPHSFLFPMLRETTSRHSGTTSPAQSFLDKGTHKSSMHAIRVPRTAGELLARLGQPNSSHQLRLANSVSSTAMPHRLDFLHIVHPSHLSLLAFHLSSMTPFHQPLGSSLYRPQLSRILDLCYLAPSMPCIHNHVCCSLDRMTALSMPHTSGTSSS